MFNRRTFLATSVAALGLTPMQVSAAQPFNIVATTSMITDLVRSIGGEAATVRGLMGPGVDPHAYRQTRTDIVAMTRADAVFWHGLYLEAQMEDFFAQLARRVPVVAAADRIATDKLIAHADYAGRYDPHIWMDPTIWAECADVVANELGLLRPDFADLFMANAETFRKDALALDEYARDVLSRVPEERRVLVTAHDAFGYFGEAYDFAVEGIQGISTESEAGLNRIITLVDLLVERQVPAVFTESSVSDRNVRALIEGAAAKGHNVRLGGSLFSDAMGREGTYEGTWLGMIDHNVTTIAAALGADVPATGRLGKLGS